MLVITIALSFHPLNAALGENNLEITWKLPTRSLELRETKDTVQDIKGEE